jgi:hypothetical protein
MNEKIKKEIHRITSDLTISKSVKNTLDSFIEGIYIAGLEDAKKEIKK